MRRCNSLMTINPSYNYKHFLLPRKALKCSCLNGKAFKFHWQCIGITTVPPQSLNKMDAFSKFKFEFQIFLLALVMLTQSDQAIAKSLAKAQKGHYCTSDDYCQPNQDCKNEVCENRKDPCPPEICQSDSDCPEKFKCVKLFCFHERIIKALRDNGTILTEKGDECS